MRKILLFVFCLIFSLFVLVKDVSAAGAKRITVNLASQTLTAWEGDAAVFSTEISSGLPQTPTVRGTFSVYSKLASTRMQGGSQAYGRYDLPNVPHVMFFYQGYAIHGAYWHNNFGSPQSHGCVNAPLGAAAWLYNWAPIGIPVSIN